MDDSSEQADPREARLRALEAAIEDMAREARSARMALCQNELEIRLDNIIRRAEALRR